MAKSVNASKITDGQINDAVEKLRAALRKHREEVSTGVFQSVLGVKNIGMECLRFSVHMAKQSLK